jgi:predicted thioredoxin/glutaredoxin
MKSATTFGAHNKDTKMNIESIVAALENLPAEAKRDLVARLSTDSIAEMSAAAADKAAKTRVAKISEMRASRDPQFRLIEGALGRAGIKIEDVTGDIFALDKLLASGAGTTIENRMMIKSGLHQLGFIAA